MPVMDNNEDKSENVDCDDSDQNDNDVTNGTHEKKKKKFDALIPTRKEPFSVRSKENVLSFIQKQFVCLDFGSACHVLKVFVNDLRVPQLFIYKTVMHIFLRYFTNDTNRLLQLMRNVVKLDINKRELILDMIIHFLKSNDRTVAKQYIDSNHVYIQYNRYRSQPQIDAYLKAYIVYVEYLEWKHLTTSEHVYRFDDSAKIIYQKVTLNIKKLISESKDCQLDMLVDIAIDMYEHEKQYEEALNLLRDYVKLNCDHLNAYIYLYEYLKHCHQIASVDDELLALKNIARLCVSHPLVMELAKRQLLPIDENIQLVLEFIDRKENSDNVEAWILLSDLCRNLNQQNEFQQKVKKMWKECYSYYMNDLYFNDLNTISSNVQNEKLFKCKKEIFNFFDS